jgi:hypothetical protein
MHGGTVGSQNTWTSFVADETFRGGESVEGSPTSQQSPKIAADWEDTAGNLEGFAPVHAESGADVNPSGQETEMNLHSP